MIRTTILATVGGLALIAGAAVPLSASSAAANSAAASPAAASPASRPGRGIPASLAAAIHASLGPGPIRLGTAPGPKIVLDADVARAVAAGPAWTSTATPTATLAGGKADGTAGYSVSMSADGTTALIGAPGLNTSTGAAYIYHASAEGSWINRTVPKAILTNSGGAENDRFGTSVALSANGTTALIGAPGANGGAGAAYVFNSVKEDEWTTTSAPAAILTNSAGAAGDDLGTSVALRGNGTTALIGAPGVSSSAGAAYIFSAASATSWTTTSSPTATLTVTGAGAEQLGGAVTLSTDGTTALAGAEWAGPGVETGAAYIFHVATRTSWTSASTPTATLNDASGPAEQAAGDAVALSSDGTTALLGAFGQGEAYVYHAPAEKSWTSMSSPAAILSVGGASESNGAGWSVALSANGATAITGTYFVNNLEGAAYVFEASSESTWASTSAPAATLTYSGATKNYRVGFSVAFPADAEIALIGVPGGTHFRGDGFIYSAGS